MQSITRNWNLFRILRVALGVFILAQGLVSKDVFSMVLGITFAGMAVLNVGCCGAGGCSTDTSFSKKNTDTKEVIFEEVTDKR